MTVLIVCLICDRQREVFSAKGYTVCGNCGIGPPRIIKERKITDNWEPKDGLVKSEVLRRTYAGLKWLQEVKKYSDKWAIARYKAIFGTWPPREIEHVLPSPPCGGLMHRIHLDNQKYKRRKREEERAVIPKVEEISPLMTADDLSVNW